MTRRVLPLRAIVAAGLAIPANAVVASAEASSPSYWDAVFQVGYDPATGAMSQAAYLGRMRRLGAYLDVVQQGVTADPSVDDVLGKTRLRIAGLDARTLYEVMPCEDPESAWRGIGLRGGIRDGAYRVELGDPEILAWRRQRDSPRLDAWGPQQQFGDTGFRGFLLPGSGKTLQFSSELQVHLGGFPAGNLVRAACRFLDITGRKVRRAAEGGGPGRGLDAAVLDAFEDDFPALYATLTKYLEIQSVVEAYDPDGAVRYDLRLALHEKALKRQYPALARALLRAGKVLGSESRLTDDADRTLLWVTRNRDRTVMRLRARMLGDLLLPLDPSEGGREHALDLQSRAPRTLKSRADYELNLIGARLEIHGLCADVTYTFQDAGSRLEARVTKPPERIETKGFVLGFLPVWLVNLAIPSNLEQMTARFFTTLAEGREGKGLSLVSGCPPEPALQRNYYLQLETELRSNGALNFGFNLYRKITGGRSALKQDMDDMGRELWEAFKEDNQGNESIECFRLRCAPWDQPRQRSQTTNQRE